MYVPGTTDLEKITKAADNITRLNSSKTAKDAYARLELYEIDLTTTLENGAHPVIGTTISPESWSIYSPGTYENLLPEWREFAALIQGDHPAKVPSPYFDANQDLARMIQEARDTICELNGKGRFICVLVPESGIAGDQIVIVSEGDYGTSLVNIFDVDAKKYNEAMQ